MAAVRMTEGSIAKHLITYSLPLILGNLFQLTYNAVDSIIVGRFIGKEALAAVGTASPVMNIMVLGISGICIGASVLMSGFFGAGNNEMLKKEMATTAVFGVYFSLIIALLGILVAKPMLKVLKVPDEIIGISVTYLRLIFLGVPFTYFYNAVSSAMKSVGDSKTPLTFLVVASVLNAGLDIILIGVFRFGIICSAMTTVAAQAVSAVLCIWYVYKRIPLLQVKSGEFRIDRDLLRQTLRYGGVTALQQSCQPIGKLLIQGAVNPLGIDIMAAFNAVNRVDDYACTPQQSISNGITTFIAQNRGAGKTERIKGGLTAGFCLSFIYWIFIGTAVLVFKEPIMRLFVSGDSSGVIGQGCEYLTWMAFFYIFPGFTNGMQGYFRGMGQMKMTLLGTIIQISFRVLFVYLLVPEMGIRGVAIACAIGWSAMLLVQFPYVYYIQKGGVAKFGWMRGFLRWRR